MDRPPPSQSDRFLLWVDAVGGYWVCLGDEVVLGQASSPRADVPILGDLSGRHARIRRDGEGYLIDAFRPVRVNGRPVEQVAFLADGYKIQLGEAVHLVFRRPHALSATARLDFLSHHRTEPSVDAVLLMADTCVLGPNRCSHVLCRQWSAEVVLYRQEGQLYCRAPEAMEIDGARVKNSGPITLRSRIVGAHFSFSLEPV
ncbi:MAG: FHA domain-containing protein [Thermoguttaceae bacterium]